MCGIDRPFLSAASDRHGRLSAASVGSERRSHIGRSAHLSRGGLRRSRRRRLGARGAYATFHRVPTRLRLADLLAGLSVAAGLGFGLPPDHAMRSCLIGTALAREMGLAEEEVSDAFYATLL